MMWISHERLMSLPTSGPAWEAVLKAANASWGSADLSNNDSQHDVLTLAGALVAHRLNDSNMRAKVVTALQSAQQSKLARALEAGRGLAAYIIAADLIDYRTGDFGFWIIKTITAPIQGHSGGVGVLGTAMRSPTNWGGHCRASLAAAAIYTQNEEFKQKVITAQKAMIGLPAPGNEMKYSSTTWHAGSPQAGMNVKSAVKDGKVLSGVLPEDWRRGADFKWPPSISNYMWGGMEGMIVTAVLLHNAGWLHINEGDKPLVRGLDMLYGTGAAAANNPRFIYPAEGDDTWQPWIVNSYHGTNFPTTPARSGKGMGYTDWTHATPVGDIEEPPPPPPDDKFPLDIIDSQAWKLTLPTGAENDPDDVRIPLLESYSSEWFHLNLAEDGAVFKAPTDGVTTENSDNPRSELREMTLDGSQEVAWSTAEGIHSLNVELTIDAVPIGSKPAVVVAQIHGSDDDLTVFRFEGNTTGDRTLGSLWITDGDTSHGYLITNNLRLGQKIVLGFRVADDVVTYSYNGQPVPFTLEASDTGAYFKAGAYNQAGGIVTPLPDGQADYAQVTIYALQVCHDELCTGQAPGTTPPPPPPTGDPKLVVTGSEAALAALKAFLLSDTSSLKVTAT